MKKFLKISLALMLVLGMSTTAFAAGSKTDRTEVSGATDANGNTVQIQITEVTDVPEAGITNGTAPTDTFAQILQTSASDIQVIDTFDITAPEGIAEGETVTVTFKVDGVRVGDTYVVMHFENGQWVALPTRVVADGTIEADFTGFSPAAIVLVAKAASTNTNTAATTTTTTTTSSTTSPKTGEVQTTAVAGMIALCAVAAAFAAYRRQRA